MQISIKQPEVTAAVRAYIAAQGINLAGKEFSVKYTAGRGDGGLSAEVEILSKDLPDFIDDDASAAVATTAIAAASSKGKTVLKAGASEKKEPTDDKAPEPKPEVPAESTLPAAGVEAPPEEAVTTSAKTVAPSLFS